MMKRLAKTTGVWGALILATACASAPRGPRLARMTPPTLMGCSLYSPSDQPSNYQNRFWIDVTVDEHGEVVPGSGRRRAWHYESGREVFQAIRLAESCRFTPAERAGVPVQSQALVDVAF